MAPPRRLHRVLDDPHQLAIEYQASSSIADLAGRLGTSQSTIRRALVRHGIDRLPRNRNRRPVIAQRLDDAGWLAARYQVATGVEIAAELEVSSRAVYAAMERHGITRRAHPSIVKLRRPELTDDDWLHRAVKHRSSTSVASDLGVSAGTVTAAYRDAGIDPASTTKLYARGRPLNRPSPETLQAVWPTQRSYRAVGSRFGIAHSTAAVWLAEAGIFADPIPKLARQDLLNAIGIGWPLTRIAGEHHVSVTAVRIELHRHNLFEAHRTRHHRAASTASS